jgi:hypothetical protein
VKNSGPSVLRSTSVEFWASIQFSTRLRQWTKFPGLRWESSSKFLHLSVWQSLQFHPFCYQVNQSFSTCGITAAESSNYPPLLHQRDF